MLEFLSDGLKMEYEVIGEGRPFVFLHGQGGSVKQIESAYDPIEGVMLINMNQQGHGNSEVDYDKLSFDALADNVIDLLQHLHIEKAVFGGISMGAAVSLNIAVRYPEYVEKLCLIRNAWADAPMSTDLQKAFDTMAEGLKRKDKEYFIHSDAYRIVDIGSDYTRNAFLIPFDEEASLREYRKFTILPKKQPIQSIKDIENIRVPVTVIACKGDLCHPFEISQYITEHIPHCRFVEIPNKDEDPKAHRQISNEEIKALFK